MNTSSEKYRDLDKALWHITVELAYEGGFNDTCQVGVEYLRQAFDPLIASGSGIKQFFLSSLPEKESS